MTTYQVLHHLDGSVVMEMEAAHMHAVPTAVSGDHGMLGLAQRLMRCKNTVYQIAHRCGPYDRLVRKDGQEKPLAVPGAGVAIAEHVLTPGRDARGGPRRRAGTLRSIVRRPQ